MATWCTRRRGVPSMGQARPPRAERQSLLSAAGCCGKGWRRQGGSPAQGVWGQGFRAWQAQKEGEPVTSPPRLSLTSMAWILHHTGFKEGGDRKESKQSGSVSTQSGLWRPHSPGWGANPGLGIRFPSAWEFSYWSWEGREDREETTGNAQA